MLGARREPILEQLVAEIIVDGGKAAHKATDVRRRADLEALVETAVQLFTRQDCGHVINVVSTAGLKILPSIGVYGATKNAV